jgi:nucleoside-diphosphate-sugar epimerase
LAKLIQGYSATYWRAELKILVTGANGFVGRALCPLLEHAGHQVSRVVRCAQSPNERSIADITESSDWAPILNEGIDAVVHLAAKVSLMNAGSDAASGTTFAEYCQINARSAENFARQCAEKGVKRFIFISTVKVLGEGSDHPYQSTDAAIPSDAYAISKWEAEQSLQRIGLETGMEIVVLRPPLVYGPGVQGNFLRMLEAIDHRRPMPFGLVRNRRSLLYVENLADAIRVCLVHPAAANQAWMISDAQDVSTPELILALAAALKRTAILLPVPVSWMKFMARILNKESVVTRLVGSLSVDSQPIRTVLTWSPPYTLQSGLDKTAAWYLRRSANQ